MRRPTPIDPDSDLSTDHLGVFGGLEVVDVKFKSYSVYARLNGYGMWPSIATLCMFVCREGYPCPANVHSVVKYSFGSLGVVYRMYIRPVCSQPGGNRVL